MDDQADRMLTVRCACGWVFRAPLDELVLATQEHGRRMHNMAATRDQVLAMVVPTGEEADPRHESPGAGPG